MPKRGLTMSHQVKKTIDCIHEKACDKIADWDGYDETIPCSGCARYVPVEQKEAALMLQTTDCRDKKFETVTVGEIVKDYLLINGFDGLCNDDCGCGVDDLFTCDHSPYTCVPAYKCNCDHHCNDYAACYTDKKHDHCWMDER